MYLNIKVKFSTISYHLRTYINDFGLSELTTGGIVFYFVQFVTLKVIY